jgi:hypothetical protein
MRSSSLLTNVFLMVVGSAIVAACVAGAVEGSGAQKPPAGAARLDGGPLTREVHEQRAG